MRKYKDDLIENDSDTASSNRYKTKKRKRRKKTQFLVLFLVCIIGGGTFVYSSFNENSEQAEELTSNGQQPNLETTPITDKQSEPASSQETIETDTNSNEQAEKTSATGTDNDVVKVESAKKEILHETVENPLSEEKEVEHIVAAGDSLYKLAIQYYQNAIYQQFLAEYNNINNSNDLQIGQSLKIPFPPPSEWHEDDDDYVGPASTNKEVHLTTKTHEVVKGDTLYRISIKYYNSPDYQEFIAEQNGLHNPGDLNVGDILQIPSLPEE